MDKAAFDLLTELVMMLDERITQREKVRKGAARRGFKNLADYSQGKIAGYQATAAWAREKLKADQPVEYKWESIRSATLLETP